MVGDESLAMSDPRPAPLSAAEEAPAWRPLTPELEAAVRDRAKRDDPHAALLDRLRLLATLDATRAALVEVDDLMESIADCRTCGETDVLWCNTHRPRWEAWVLRRPALLARPARPKGRG